MRRDAYIVVACTCLVVLSSSGSAAGTETATQFGDNQVHRAFDLREFVDADNELTGDVVHIFLPAQRAVIVTYSADMFAEASLVVGLKVNSRDCQFYGPAAFSSETQNHTSTLRWIVTADEISSGRNRFEVCISGTGAYDLRTLTVERVL